MKLYKFLPYHKNLVARGRELRKSETGAEKKFWFDVLKNEKLAHLKFTRQKPIGNFIVDFYCAKLKLAVEIDGEIHKFQKTRDDERDNMLKQEFGVKIIRYKNEEVLYNSNWVLEDLIRHINTTPPILPLSGERKM